MLPGLPISADRAGSPPKIISNQPDISVPLFPFIGFMPCATLTAV